MSARLEKLKRRAARAEAGLSKQDERGQREFEAAVARVRAASAADDEIRSLAPRRRALAWAALTLWVAAVLGVLAAVALGGQ